MITVENLRFDYPHKSHALSHISFTILPGTITALVGPNNAGKTTLLRCLAALEVPTSGKIRIDHHDTEQEPQKIHQIVSYISDSPGLHHSLTVAQHLTFFALNSGCAEEQITHLISSVAHKLRLSAYLGITVNKLSRGLRQCLAVAQTFICRPKVLLLDEPAAGLDLAARHHLAQLLVDLKQEGIAIIVSSHILTELEKYCSEILLLDRGKLIKHCPLNDLLQTATFPTLLIEFSVEAALCAPLLKTIPSLNLLEVAHHQATVSFQGEPIPRSVLLKMLIAKNLPVCGIYERVQTLPDLYLCLTQTVDQGNV